MHPVKKHPSQSNAIRVARPAFLKAWKLFKDVKISVKDVGEKIGGKIKANIDSGIFANACSIRMSYVLNHAGVPIPSGAGYAVVSGADNAWYMYRVTEMHKFLSAKWGPPDVTAKQPAIAHFQGKKGILLVMGSGWGNASGHITIWNGAICSDVCHLMGDSENGRFTPIAAYLWVLK